MSKIIEDVDKLLEDLYNVSLLRDTFSTENYLKWSDVRRTILKLTKTRQEDTNMTIENQQLWDYADEVIKNNQDLYHTIQEMFRAEIAKHENCNFMDLQLNIQDNYEDGKLTKKMWLTRKESK